MYKKIYLKRNQSKNILSGHPWIFSGAILQKENLSDGELCEVYMEKTFAGIGYYNSKTDIAIRILSRKMEEITCEFFTKKIAELRKQKETIITNTNAYRLVFAESDNLPGFIVDKYNDVFVVEFHTLGANLLRNEFLEALKTVFPSLKSIYEKKSEHTQNREGFNVEEKFLYGEEIENVEITENGFLFSVDIPHGQKTGFFLDQRENRAKIIPYTADRNVLNCFSYTGAFSVYAAKKAKKVTSIDISAPAIARAKQNFLLNKIDPDQHEFLVADVFDYIRNFEKDKFDCIILDPPSLTRSKNHLKSAITAYVTINSEALKRLPFGGILITSSCTSHIDEALFLKILYQSAVNAGCQLKIIESSLQPFDHAINLHFPFSRYLKFFILHKS